MIGGEGAEPIVSLAEAQAFARIETGEEEATIAGLIRTASALCEAFLNQVVLERAFSESIAAAQDWQKLGTVPVRSITGVAVDGLPLGIEEFAADIDSNGRGWIRLTNPAVRGSVEVRGSAGLAASQNAVPEPIRHGVLRLVAHLFGSRDGTGGEIPAAVAALWRPYRRMRLA